MTDFRATILGEVASKSNSRKLATVVDKVTKKPRVLFIKSEKARDWVRDAQKQLNAKPRAMFAGPVQIEMTIFYASELPDLDESLVLDVLQGFAYANDRQVRRKVVAHAIDRANPRVELVVRPMQAQQNALPLRADPLAFLDETQLPKS